MKKISFFFFFSIVLVSCDDFKNKPKLKLIIYSKDLNGFPKNPKWAQQIYEGKNPIVENICPVTSVEPSDWNKSPTCTDCGVTYNLPVDVHRVNCEKISNNNQICGHVNFTPILYEGIVNWGSNILDPDFELYDGDFAFHITREDEALYTSKANFIEAEFDSRETTAMLQKSNGWWGDFHKTAIQDFAENNLSLKSFDATKFYSKTNKMINNKKAIILGMLGLDCVHVCKTEIHPIYAMFINVLNTKGDSWWAFFVRNWGNEGYCSSGQVNLNDRVLSFFIPQVEELLPNSIIYSSSQLPQDGMITKHFNQDGGIKFTFHLMPSDKKSWFVGDLHLKPKL